MKKEPDMNRKTASLDEQLRGGLEFMKKMNAGGVSIKTLRSTKVIAEVPKYDAKKVKSLRHKLRVSQGVLAHVIGVSPRTVQKWEIGENHPTGATATLLNLIETIPEVREKLVPA